MFQDKFPEKYLEGIRLFNEGLYFESHEVWEDLWKEVVGQEKLFYQALIQAAAALLKFESGIPTGAEMLYNKVLPKLTEIPDHYLGLDVRKFEREFKLFFSELWAAPDRSTVRFPREKVPKIVLK
ncbi:MAG: DUF309 domain-containing protein [Deltaproteobacteria bacterium]|nr:DUF309 domain-containing protein [Deltaproteobacteria bacterium]